MIDRRQLLNMASLYFVPRNGPRPWRPKILKPRADAHQQRSMDLEVHRASNPSQSPYNSRHCLTPQRGKDATPTQARRALRSTIDQVINHGFTGIGYPTHLTSELDHYVMNYARSRGMFFTYNYTFAKGGVENFGRNAPPAISVYVAEYAVAVRKNFAPVLAEGTQLPGFNNLFCYQDEPFHAGPESFDLSDEARHQFHKRFGYDLPSRRSRHACVQTMRVHLSL